MGVAAFERLSQRVLASGLGEDALLRGTIPCRVVVEHGVEIAGEYGEVAYTREVATIGRDVSPRVGDTLTLLNDGKRYVLDAAMQDNGYTFRYILRDV